MNTVKALKSWYRKNGYMDAAENTEEILQAWKGKERILLAILTKEPFKL